MDKIPVLAVAGPTASGKTNLAVGLCQALGGEVVSADSMQVYRDMPIATAQPGQEERGGIAHHLVGFLPVSADFSVAAYVDRARACIADIHARGHLPVVAGGTGLYLHGLLSGMVYAPISEDPALRASLAAYADANGNQALHARLCRIDPQAAARIHPNNRKRVLRALEIHAITGQTPTQAAAAALRESPYRSLLLCLNFRDRATLYARIDARVQQMLRQGLVEECRRLSTMQLGSTAAQALGYKELAPYLHGTCTLEQAVQALQRATRRYAKRQLTWFRREAQAHWLYVDDYPDAGGLLQAALQAARGFLEGGGCACANGPEESCLS